MKCAIFDFDYTIAHFTGGYDGLFAIFTKKGIPLDIVIASYEKVKAEKGFNIWRLINKISETTNMDLDNESIEREFMQWLSESLVIYPDSLFAIESFMKKRIPVIILTAGEEEYQRQKISAVGIQYDELIVIPRVNEKITAIRNLLEKYGAPLVIFDDKASELDSLRDQRMDNDKVITVMIRRSDSPYFNQMSRYRHEEADAFTEKIIARFIK